MCYNVSVRVDPIDYLLSLGRRLFPFHRRPFLLQSLAGWVPLAHEDFFAGNRGWERRQKGVLCGKFRGPRRRIGEALGI